jgi:hypothetical protein
VNEALLVVASTVSVLTIVVVGATLQVLDQLRWMCDRIDRVQSAISDPPATYAVGWDKSCIHSGCKLNARLARRSLPERRPLAPRVG